MMVEVGFAQLALPVPPGQPMMGHTRDDYGATGTHDPLLCKAIVWVWDNRSVGLVTLDLCMVDASFVDEAKEKITESTGITGESMLICATHTHSGPAVFSLYEAPVMEKDVREAIIDTIARCVGAAAAATQSASYSYGTAECGEQIGFYRRLRRRDGSTAMNWEAAGEEDILGPWGTFDAKVRVLGIKGDGLHLCVVNYPLHPAILDYTNSLYSRDYPGYLEKALKQMMGDQLQVVFANGLCGTINHIDYRDRDMPRRGYAAAQRVGYVLAAAVVEALRDSTPIEVSGIGKKATTVALERIQVPKELEQKAKDTLAIRKDAIPTVTDGLPFELQSPLICRLAEIAHSALDARLSVTRLGPLYLFGFPGEMAYELQKLLGESLGDIPWMAIELADDAIGYVAHREAYAQGGYETQVGATKVAAGSGERLVRQALDLYGNLHEQ